MYSVCGAQIDMQVLVFIAVTAAFVEAYVSKNDAVSYAADVTSYRKLRPRNFLLGPPFAEEIMGQQIPLRSPAKDQTISQQALQNISLRERAVYPSEFPILRHQPFKQNAVTATTFSQPLFRDTLSRSQEIRGQRGIVEDNPFVEQGTSFASDEIFEEQASMYRSQVPFKEQPFTAGASFKNLLHGQSVPGEQTSFQKQVTSAEVPSIFNTKVYRDDTKPIDSYGWHKDVLPHGGSWTEYSNHALGMSSMPMISSSEHLSPSDVGEVDSLEAFRMKFGPIPTSRPTMSTSTGKCNALVNSSPTTSSSAATVPSISVSANQSSIVGHILTSLTTKPSSLVTTTATPIAFTGNTIGPTYFHATKYGAALTSLPTKSELRNNLMLEAPKNSMKTDIQSSMLNYILSEEYKNGVKSSLANYALPEGLKQDWSLQQFAQPEASGYVPLSLNGKTNLIVSSLPVAPISTISWPMETKTISTMLPAKSVITDMTTSNDLPIGLNLPSDFMGSIPNSLTPSISNSISESITGSISTSIPSGMTSGMPASIPTLSLGQSLHRAEQLQQTQEARNLWYPTGLQLQLGGFGGINYTLHESNTAMRPMELGMAKAGLTPKLPQAHEPAFAKVSSQGVIASFASPGSHVARKLL